MTELFTQSNVGNGDTVVITRTPPNSTSCNVTVAGTFGGASVPLEIQTDAGSQNPTWHAFTTGDGPVIFTNNGEQYILNLDASWGLRVVVNDGDGTTDLLVELNN